MSNKGSNYERDLSRQLSLWASNGKADDWYWRSSQSGGRATSRFKKGKTTTGHCGDICSTCTDSEWLTKLFCIEAKKGYGDSGNPFNVIDRAENAKQGTKGTFHGFVLQAMEARNRSGSRFYMLIYRRPKKQDMVYLPMDFWKVSGSTITQFLPVVRMDFAHGHSLIQIGGVLLEDFLNYFNPKFLKKLLSA